MEIQERSEAENCCEEQMQVMERAGASAGAVNTLLPKSFKCHI